MSRLLHRLGHSAARRPWWFVLAWIVVVAGTVASLVASGSQFDSEATIPGSEAQAGIDILERALPTATGVQGQLVFVAADGGSVNAPATKAAIEQAVHRAASAPQVATVSDPFEQGLVSGDGTVAIANVLYPVKRDALDDASVDALEDIARDAGDDTLSVEVGGTIYSTGDVPVTSTELLGLLAAVVVLVITFGSLLAAGTTLVSALIGLAVGLVGLLLVSNLVSVSSTAPTLALMIGLAVGIDYALFLISRHRAQLAAGQDVEESIARAVATAGSAVIFAGLTVVIALAGLTVVGIPFLSGMGLAAAWTVLLAVVTAVTLLPAVLGLAGERLRPRRRAARRPQPSQQPALGRRWLTLVTRRPWVTCVLVVVALGVVAVPATALRLALPDNGTAPTGSTQRKAYDHIADAFGPGYNGRLLVLVQADSDPVAAARRITDGLDLPGIAAISDPQAGQDGHTAVVQIIPRAGPRTVATEHLVGDLRDTLPPRARDAGAEVLVTGSTAAALDVSEKLRQALLPFVLVVVGLSLVLLTVAFRSILIPVKAVLGFLLSVAATFGVVVAVIQWGWLADALGVSKAGPVFSFMPILVMAVLFGLAMDYEVFLLSRVREAYVATGDPRGAIVDGGAGASRVITAAALIMLAVFTGFASTDDLSIKPIALGLAVGVAIDAFLVRMTVVPAVLAILGHPAWWLPQPMARWMPHLDLEGSAVPKPRTPSWPPAGHSYSDSPAAHSPSPPADQPTTSTENPPPTASLETT